MNSAINQADLHSTMFLLIPAKYEGRGGSIFEFTFHNVSINTIYCSERIETTF